MSEIAPPPPAQPALERYPGALPFQPTLLDQQRFYGRETDVEALLRMLRSVDLCVLFAKPGAGKTSLLNAGIFPRLEQLGYLPLPVRFDHSEDGDSPFRVMTRSVERACAWPGIDFAAGLPGSLWAYFKTAKFWRGRKQVRPVLVFDQFEELFTRQTEEFRSMAAEEIGDLASSRLPDHVRKALEKGEAVALTEAPPDVRVLISVREDELGRLHSLTPQIPHLLQHLHRLGGLSRADAERAVDKPAELEDPRLYFRTKGFRWARGAVESVIQAATFREEISPFWLQVQCCHVERKVRERQERLDESIIVQPEDIATLKEITADFYQTTLLEAPERAVAQRICEKLVGISGRRVFLPADEFRTSRERTAIQYLERVRLLQTSHTVEPVHYEISHQWLAAAIHAQREQRSSRDTERMLETLDSKIAAITGLVKAVVPMLHRCVQEGDDQLRQGRLELALQWYGHAHRMAGKLLEITPDDHDAERLCATINDKHGNAERARGELESALRWYQSALEIRQRIVGKQPAALEAQREVSLSLIKIADIHRVLGSPDLALHYCQQALRIRERMTGADARAARRRDLALAHQKCGDIQRQIGELEPAHRHYASALSITETLAAEEPANLQWKQDLADSYERIGDFWRGRDLGETQKAYEACIRLREELASLDPTNTLWQRNLSLTYERWGDLHWQTPDPAKAHSAFHRAVEIAKRLAEQDPTNAQWQSDLAFGHAKIAAFLTHDPEAAAREYEIAIQLLRPLAAEERLTVDQRSFFEEIQSRPAALRKPGPQTRSNNAENA